MHFATSNSKGLISGLCYIEWINNGHRKSEKEKKKLSWKQGEHVIDIEVFFLKKNQKNDFT